jgi:RimJ/RimL family protein N-acetyltransferase
VANLETILESERLWIEPLRAEHAGELFAILSDLRLYRFIPQDPPPTLASLEERFRRLQTRCSPRGDELWLNWVLRSKAEGGCMGRVQATIQPEDRAWLAYDLDAARWGQGFATEACARVIRSLFEDHGVARILAEVDTRNAASIRLLERLGFSRGELRRNADFFKGSTSDELTYSLERTPRAAPGG